MLKKTNTLIAILNVAKILLLIIALIYVFIWISMLFLHDVFLVIDDYFNYLPSKFDMVFKPSAKVDNAAPMGYMYAGCLCAFLSLICINVSKSLVKKRDAFVEKKSREDIKKQQKLKQEREKKELEAQLGIELDEYGLVPDIIIPEASETPVVTKKIKKENKKQQPIKKEEIKPVKEQNIKQDEFYEIKTLYGLFEIKIRNISNKKEDYQTLAEEYCKMLSKKIKEKYSTIKYAISDKIFIVFDDFSSFGELIEDIMKIYNVLFQINRENNLETIMFFSFWCDRKPNVAKIAYNTLLKINNLNYKNKIVITKPIKIALERNENNLFEIKTLGVSKMTDYNNRNIKVELFCLKIK